MAKTEFIGSAEVAKLLGVSLPHLYGWGSDDRRKRRPFFPKSQMVRRATCGDRRLIHQWDKKAVLKFIKEAKEKPYYLLSEHQYEALKEEHRQKSELPPSAFVEFNKLMFTQKQKRMEC